MRKKNISIRDDRNKLKKSNQELKQKLASTKAQMSEYLESMSKTIDDQKSSKQTIASQKT